MAPSIEDFPEFSLTRLMQTVFAPKAGERVAVLIDLADPKKIVEFPFPKAEEDSVIWHAIHTILTPLREEVIPGLKLEGGDIFAFEETGGSNLELPDEAYAPTGEKVSLASDVYPKYDIILAVTKYSATAPLTTHCKKFNFRGSTMHGLNNVIRDSGLSVDYDFVSAQAEKLRLGYTKADAVEIDFEVEGRTATLRLDLEKQEAQKSHGISRIAPDIANLPAGEVYFVPEKAEGTFPFKFDDGSIALLEVKDLRIVGGEVVKGGSAGLDELMGKIKEDASAGKLGELGFGTQELPVSGRDIQDEKILGTLHVATGRSDHLGGSITPDEFSNPKNASHEDILFAPFKTPEINVPQARLIKDGKTEVLIENYVPSAFVRQLLS